MKKSILKTSLFVGVTLGMVVATGEVTQAEAASASDGTYKSAPNAESAYVTEGDVGQANLKAEIATSLVADAQSSVAQAQSNVAVLSAQKADDENIISSGVSAQSSVTTSQAATDVVVAQGHVSQAQVNATSAYSDEIAQQTKTLDAQNKYISKQNDLVQDLKDATSESNVNTTVNIQQLEENVAQEQEKVNSASDAVAAAVSAKNNEDLKITKLNQQISDDQVRQRTLVRTIQQFTDQIHDYIRGNIHVIYVNGRTFDIVTARVYLQTDNNALATLTDTLTEAQNSLVLLSKSQNEALNNMENVQNTAINANINFSKTQKELIEELIQNLHSSSSISSVELERISQIYESKISECNDAEQQANIAVQDYNQALENLQNAQSAVDVANSHLEEANALKKYVLAVEDMKTLPDKLAQAQQNLDESNESLKTAVANQTQASENYQYLKTRLDRQKAELLFETEHPTATGYIEGSDGNWYWFENGRKYTGFKNYMGAYYFFINGVRQDNQLVQQWGNTYYVGNDGRAVQGLMAINGKAYNFGNDKTFNNRGNADGYLKDITDGSWYWFENGNKYTGFRFYMGAYYYFVNGVRQENQFVTQWGHMYYVGSNGRAVQGITTINGVAYDFGTDSTFYSRGKANGYLKNSTDNKWYWFENGNRYTGFRFYMGSYYYFVNGVRQTNQFVTEWGHTYYLGSNGRALQGVHVIDGKTYNFGSNNTFYLR